MIKTLPVFRIRKLPTLFGVPCLGKPALLSIKKCSCISRKHLQDLDFYHPSNQQEAKFRNFFVPTYFFVTLIGGIACFSHINLLFLGLNRPNSKISTFPLIFLEENIGQIQKILLSSLFVFKISRCNFRINENPPIRARKRQAKNYKIEFSTENILEQGFACYRMDLVQLFGDRSDSWGDIFYKKEVA